MAITIAFQLWCILLGAVRGRQRAVDAIPTGFCLCFPFSRSFFFFFEFFIYAGSCKNFQFYEFTFCPARSRERVGQKGGSQIRLRISCRLQLQPNCQLSTRPTSVWSFALFAMPHKSVQYFLYDPLLHPPSHSPAPSNFFPIAFALPLLELRRAGD